MSVQKRLPGTSVVVFDCAEGAAETPEIIDVGAHLITATEAGGCCCCGLSDVGRCGEAAIPL